MPRTYAYYNKSLIDGYTEGSMCQSTDGGKLVLKGGQHMTAHLAYRLSQWEMQELELKSKFAWHYRKFRWK